MQPFLRAAILALPLALAAGAAPAAPDAGTRHYAQAQAPLPPVRPATPDPAKANAGAPAANMPVPNMPAQGTPPSLDRVNGYFNAMRGLRADFVQISPDGRRFGGVLHLLRPGRMRFEYNPPATLEIVSDGRSVAIRDRKLNTQDLYLIGQTPLKFLLQPKIDIAKDAKVIDLRRAGAEILLDIEDRGTIGGTSKIRVVFDGESHALKEWTVTDPQGATTRVMLSNLNLAALPDKALFVIDDQPLINPR
ncbi:MAG: outer membrane lipoprotein carrier protein LolA [Hyphomicrobiales bacterium]|uniref:LolA family protein n=1 Tax=Rhabdaerophilum calidifontis TaxID=2604328 RepID=UPI00123A858B|nr:outer membrane lipoprotein carrier protein LolA [Rhabdaerophilum calidifontis]MCA1999365.1 outer membrane lipoprotein carrier protein LolA [Hyphomicrobiales bacterium]